MEKIMNQSGMKNISQRVKEQREYMKATETLSLRWEEKLTLKHL